MSQRSYNEMVEKLAEIKQCSKAVAACLIMAAIANFADTLTK